jgi:hypothetical protein
VPGRGLVWLRRLWRATWPCRGAESARDDVVPDRRVFRAGKTTRAKELAAGHRALRLTPDAWMIPLFGESDPDGKRDVL